MWGKVGIERCGGEERCGKVLECGERCGEVWGEVLAHTCANPWCICWGGLISVANVRIRCTHRSNQQIDDLTSFPSIPWVVCP